MHRPTLEIPVPAWLIAATARPVRPADPVPSPLDSDEVEAIRAACNKTTMELPAYGG